MLLALLPSPSSSSSHEAWSNGSAVKLLFLLFPSPCGASGRFELCSRENAHPGPQCETSPTKHTVTASFSRACYFATVHVKYGSLSRAAKGSCWGRRGETELRHGRGGLGRVVKGEAGTHMAYGGEKGVWQGDGPGWVMGVDRAIMFWGGSVGVGGDKG